MNKQRKNILILFENYYSIVIFEFMIHYICKYLNIIQYFNIRNKVNFNHLFTYIIFSVIKLHPKISQS